MRLIRLAVLYTALALGANAAAAQESLQALRDGDMRKLSFHDMPRMVPDIALLDAGDAEQRLSDYHGKIVVLNFWATWCAPCRHEMPSLDRLEAALGGPDLAVVPVATGRNPVPAIERFFTEAEVTRLPILRDPRSALSREMGVLGLPVTVILDRDGREVARLTGDADWDSASAKAILAALIAQ
ncbi:TlpA disulfide reductase family protein [Plastorhodobacter daqingensis]|uniref:TlpA disulfide reductase family protein n=1 Tax=Plastorhodobacter daqingensis TaxID=1387281 RepID=A0ABW2UE53_9RHOB